VFLDYASGDTTCTDCGTVLNDRWISDSIDYNVGLLESHDLSVQAHNNGDVLTRHDGDTRAPTASIGPNQRYGGNGGGTSLMILKEYLGALNLTGTSVATHAHDLRERVMHKYHFKARPLEAAMGCCIYLACRNSGSDKIPRTASEVFTRLCIEGVLFKRILKDVINLLPKETNQGQKQYVKPTDGLIRQIQTLKSIPLDQDHAVAKHVRDLDDLRKAKKKMMATPPTTINAVLIYIAAAQLQIPVDAAEMIGLGWISKPTLKKHVEAMMQCMC
jgi:transcription initiation factor TFIIIB Brf1 subunit/transcription initiation factor TFIIB